MAERKNSARSSIELPAGRRPDGQTSCPDHQSRLGTSADGFPRLAQTKWNGQEAGNDRQDQNMTDHELSATARWLASKAIKERIRRSGLRPLEVEAADIHRAANELLRSNGPEIFEQAKAILRRA